MRKSDLNTRGTLLSKRSVGALLGISALLFLTSPVRADNEHLSTLRVGQETYTNVTVTSVSATEIFFTHSRGIGNAKLKNLDPALQKMFHFDPTRSNAQQSDQARANALYLESVRTNGPPVKRPLTASEKPTPQQPPESAGIREHPINAKSFMNLAAPSLQVEKWLTEEPDTAGKFILLDFWATWCGPCRASIPALNQFQDRFKDRLIIIGLSDEPEQQVRRMQSPKIEYRVAIDTQHRTKSEIGVRAIPHTLLIDPKGIVRFEGHPGYLTARGLETLLTRYGK